MDQRYEQKELARKLERQRRIIVKQYKELEEYHMLMPRILQNVLVTRNIETMSHLLYVEAYSRILAINYGKLFPESKMTRQTINTIAEASKMHDVGKISMPDSLIHKSGKLSKSELYRLMEHTLLGSHIMEMICEIRNDDYSRIGYNICKYHHARYDGTGYPEDIKGNDIPVEAQIVSLADVYDVLANKPINNRKYQKDEVYDIMIGGKCGVLSPEMRACLELSRKAMEAVKINA